MAQNKQPYPGAPPKYAARLPFSPAMLNDGSDIDQIYQ